MIVEFDDTPTFETIDRKWLTSFNQFLVDKGYMTNYIGTHLKTSGLSLIMLLMKK